MIPGVRVELNEIMALGSAPPNGGRRRIAYRDLIRWMVASTASRRNPLPPLHPGRPPAGGPRHAGREMKKAWPDHHDEGTTIDLGLKGLRATGHRPPLRRPPRRRGRPCRHLRPHRRRGRRKRSGKAYRLRPRPRRRRARPRSAWSPTRRTRWAASTSSSATSLPRGRRRGSLLGGQGLRHDAQRRLVNAALHGWRSPNNPQ